MVSRTAAVLTIDACVWLATLAPREPEHAVCVDLLQTVVTDGVVLQQPPLFVVEVCATVTRTTREPMLAAAIGEAIMRMPALHVHPLDHDRSAEAAHAAMTCALRGADAVYVATAAAANATLITLDREVLERAASFVPTMSPRAWLDRHAATR